MKFKLGMMFVLIAILIAAPAIAITLTDLDVGGNITIDDTIWNSANWNQSPPGATSEDNETEKTTVGASTIAGQDWDLEGIFWNSHDATLTVIGGFDFDSGLDYNSKHYSIGDIFVGKFSNEYADPNNHDAGRLYTAEYALDLSRDANGDIVSQTSGTIYQETNANPFSLTGVTAVTPASNPYQYSDGGGSIGDFHVTTGAVDVEGVFYGYNTIETHYYLQITGLEELRGAINSGKIIHITMTCGNDSARAAVPEPTTILLSGFGLLGMGVYLRRKKGYSKA